MSKSRTASKSRAFQDAAGFPKPPINAGCAHSPFRSRADWRSAAQYPSEKASVARMAEEFCWRYLGRPPMPFFHIDPIEPNADSNIALLEYPSLIAVPAEESMNWELQGSFRNERLAYLEFNLAYELAPQLARARRILHIQQRAFYGAAIRMQSRAKLVMYLRLLDAECSGVLPDAAEFFFPHAHSPRDSADEAIQAAKKI